MSLGGSTKNKSDGTLKAAQGQLTTASNKLISTGDAATDFTSKFYNTYIQPMIGKVQSATDTSYQQNQQLYQQSQALTDQAKALATNTGVPLIKSYADQVSNFSSKQYADQMSQRAIGDVNDQQATADQTTQMRQAAIGANANSGTSQALQSQSDVQFAVAKAAAASRARALADQQALSVGSSGANLGVQLQQQPGQALSQQSAISGQGSAIPAANLGAVAGAQGTQYQGYNAAAGAYGTSASANAGVTSNANKASQDAQSQDQGGLGSFIGTAAGVIGSIFSDRRLKKDVQPVKKMPDGLIKYAFRYKWEDDVGPVHYGFMADEVAKIYPDAVGEHNGFKTVDYSKVRYL
jgi:hypothetical protein